MKKLFTLILAVISACAFGQQYNNEWIDFSRTYYKFKVAENGVYRINQPTLQAAGLSAVPAQQFRLFRNGQEVPVYTSSASGPLPANGYIEFWGEANDGKADRPLYRDPAFQHSDKISLQTDTAVYFLTSSELPLGLRIQEQPNNVGSNTLPAEPYFMFTTGNHFKERINPGFAAVVGEYVYSSSYDRGEFWSTDEIYPGIPKVDVQNNLFAYAGGPGTIMSYGASGNALNSRSVRVLLNGTLVRESQMDYFNDTLVQANLPTSLLNNGTASVQFINTSGTSTDRMVVSFYDITYPRQFNFGGARNFSFELAAKPAGFYLEITNFGAGPETPILYDLTNQQRYPAQAAGNILKFALPGSAAARKLVLVSEDPSNIRNVAALTPKKFVNFNDASVQGNYLIISNQIIYNGTNGSNPVDQYKAYRSSSAGGGYRAQVYDIDELVDQFAFGIKKHPLSVKNFLRFARARFATPPQFVFLIGHGVSYNDYRANQSDPMADRLNLIPSFGNPASDNLLSSADAISAYPLTPIGRLSVVTAKEVEDYTQKVKEYETTQQTAANTIQGRLWMKNIIHVTGASETFLGTVLCNYMEGYKQIIQDTLAGSSVTVFCKSSTSSVEQLSNQKIADLFQQGLSLVTYFGHSSSSALEFNLDDPQNYSNQGKYPVFSVNGCNAGNFFAFDAQRFTFNQTLSEKFVLAKQRGGIAFIASTHFGIVNYLNIYISDLYQDIGSLKYGSTLGEINRTALQQMVQASGTTDFYARTHAEEITLHGDPALKMNGETLPDYVIEEPQVKVSPAFISIAEKSFNVNVNMYNLGKAIRDSIAVEVKRQYPDGSVSVLYRKKIKGIFYSDSLNLVVPVIATRDKGANKLIVTVDADNSVTEASESNNTVIKEFFIYEDEAKPAFPYEFSIVSKADQKLYASTADPFSTQKQYVMEIDTTELFNSASKTVKNITSPGGVLEFTPSVTYKDSTVYYWRVSLVPPAGADYKWSSSSFVFLNQNIAGYNQSHYFQHLKSTLKNITIDPGSNWKFGSISNDLYVRSGTWITSTSEEAGVSVSANGSPVGANACAFSSLVFSVFDPVTFKPWVNTTDASGQGLYGSWANNCYPKREINFEFRYTDTASRRKILNFMDKVIPDGAYVIVRSFALDPSAYVYGIPPYSNFPQAFVNDWKADTAYFGNGNTMYQKFLQQGFTTIDSFYRSRNFIFIYKKNDQTAFPPKSSFTQGVYDNIILTADCATPDTLGFVSSPVFGPAKVWKAMHWRGKSQEDNSADNPTVEITGLDSAGNKTTLFTVGKNMQDVDISSVNPAKYPYLQLNMRNIDSVTLTPYQLKYWRLDYEPVPEGALTPNVFFTTKDSLEIGEKLNFGVAFKNISAAAFDSLRINVAVLDKDNVSHPLVLPKKKPLVSGDTLTVKFEIDTKDYPEMNTLNVDVNPNNDQPEQYHYNNFLYRNFYVKPDKVNPLMDVTFDGVHILNRDIVSARPRIQVKLKDEAKYLLLNDTSLITVQVGFPDQNNTIRTYKFDNDTLRFIPAQTGTDNTATIEFTPYFSQQFNPDGDDYELVVKGRDKSGNNAGEAVYRVTFRVINKPMISNLLNYPNPFTTSTAFVFTVTGTDVPQNMKIQILTVTGKIVREITKDELGPIHIGRNITEYKWDGKDQFGQRLANGVYLYRVVTTMNGRQMDKYKAEGDDTDKYFNRGYGKMYLMK